MKRSKFNLTHTHSTTGDAGQLIPFLLQPTLPGDRFRIGLKNFIRCQPMVAPLMHEVYFYTQYWYVPYRILWDNWEDFITGGGDLSTSPAFPQVTAPSGGWKPGSLADYFGFPVKQAGIKLSAMPFRAYAEIWNTRYRDEDLQQDVPIVYTDGNDSQTNTDILSPSWKRDYFTLSRPWTQRGSDILVPIVAGDENGASIIHKHTFNVSPSLYFDTSFTAYYEKYWQNVTMTISNAAGNGYRNGTYVYSDDKNSFQQQLKITTGIDANGDPNWWVLTGASDASSDVATVTSSTNEILTYLFGSAQDMLLKLDVNGSGERSSFNGMNATGKKLYFNVYDYNTSVGGAPGKVASIVLENPPLFVQYSLVADETVSAVGTNTPVSWTSICRVTTNSIMGINLGIHENQPSISGGMPVCPVDFYNTNVDVYVTLNQTGNVSVRDLRASSALQRYAERSLKYGNRYEEFIQREFGVKPRDSRIQRPEYLGGGRGILNISEVLQTAEGTDTSVGTMRGHGIASVAQRPIRFKSPEHGLIIGLLSIRPKAVYTQGIEREFLKKSRLDFFTPELANIGMQEVLTQELYATSGNVNQIFGYSDRYQEYRYHKPLVTGEFRDTLSYWNMARIFDNAPNLNDEFINMEYSSEVFKRPFAVQDQSYHSFLIMLENVIHAWRPIPKRAKDILR